MNQFKRRTVVMLPTNQEVNLFLDLETNKLGFTIIPLKDDPKEQKNQHLYILSDVGSKDKQLGDWCVDLELNTIVKCESTSELQSPMVCKIIATTDPELNTDKRKYIHALSEPTHLPQPSPQFIQKYIEEYNKGNVITEVLVEYDGFVCSNGHYMSHQTTCGYPHCNQYNYPKLKINPKDNTITIKRLKDSWSRDEVINLIQKLETDGADYFGQEFLKQWIDKNL